MPMLERMRAEHVIIGSFFHKPGERAAVTEWWAEPSIVFTSRLLVYLPRHALRLGLGTGGYGYLVAAGTAGELLAAVRVPEGTPVSGTSRPAAAR